MVAVGLPINNVCGAGSQVIGTDVISLTGGSLAAGASCEVDVTVQVPINAAPSTYPSTSGSISGILNGGRAVGSAATADLAVVAAFTPIARVFAQGRKPFDFNVLARALPGQGLTVTAVTNGQFGTATINPDGTLRYTPTGALPPMGDSFSYDNQTTNQVLTVTNFSALAGSLDGLIAPEYPSAERRGYVQLKISKRGSFSGKLTLLGKATGVRGSFDVLGEATTTARRGKLAPLAVALALTGAGETVTGNVATADDLGTAFTSEFVAEEKAPAGMLAGTYTALLQGSGTTGPGGTGYAILTIKADGSVRTAGKLAEGTTFRSGAFLHADQSTPLYAALYSRRGSLGGSVILDLGGADTDGSAELDWFKPERTRDTFYPDGFATELNMILSRFEKRKGTSVVDFGPTGNTRFSVFGGGVLTPLTKDVIVSSKNKITVDSPGLDKTRVRVSAGNGLLSGVFVHPESGKRTPFKGVVLQKSALGQGYFLDKLSRESGGVQIGVRIE